MRKIIQICAVPAGSIKYNGEDVSGHNSSVFALCNDGSMWELSLCSPKETWLKMKDIPQNPVDTNKYPIELLQLSVKLNNILSAEIPDIKLLVKFTEKELLRLPNIGKYSTRQIIRFLADKNLKLGMTDDEISMYDWITVFAKDPYYAHYFDRGNGK